MAVTTTNLIQGPANLYIGAFGATEAADTTLPTVPDVTYWADLGGTQDGVKVTIDREYAELEVDQITMTPERRITKLEIMVATNLAEATLANLSLVLNGGASATGGSGSTAYANYDLAVDDSSTQPTYKAIIIDGWAANGKRRRIIVRKVLSIEPVEVGYKKDEQTLFPVTFAAHWISSSIKPMHIVDSTAT